MTPNFKRFLFLLVILVQLVTILASVKMTKAFKVDFKRKNTV